MKKDVIIQSASRSQLVPDADSVFGSLCLGERYWATVRLIGPLFFDSDCTRTQEKHQVQPGQNSPLETA